MEVCMSRGRAASRADRGAEVDPGSPGITSPRVDPPNGERQLLGERLRMLRVRRRLGLADVALGTGLSRSFIAMLEAGDSDVSVSRLLRIADFYGVWISDLVGSVGPSVEIVPAADAKRLPVDEGGSVLLLSKQLVRNLQPFLVRLEPGAAIEGGLSHSGEEFIHCVAGTAELDILDTHHTLEAGDTASFPGRLPHTYRNVASVEAVLIGASARVG
ncbi:MAG: XRE family transcriptional regulator [Chloroflexota bacterium]|nr:XRE family transcriptional regulator [Chloroflexota bacterium]